MKAWLLRLLQVKKEESKIFFLVALFGFCIGVISNILYSIPLAMFLARYSTSLLPYIYIGVGLAMFFIGIGMGYLEKRLSVSHILAGCLAGFSMILLLLYGALFIVKSDWIYLILQISSLVIAYLLAGFISLVCNQIFNLQQNKRLYGPIIGGSALGGVLMGFGLKFVVNAIGTHHTIFLSFIILLGTLWTQLLIKNHTNDRLLKSSESEEFDTNLCKTSLSEFKHKKYIFYTFVFTFIVYLMYYYFELMFNTEAQKHFQTETKLAAFFGILYALCDLGGIFAGFVLSPWVLSKFGLLPSLAILPIGLFTLLSTVFLINTISPGSEFIFSILFITLIFESLIRDYITESSILMLFQPLKMAQRIWAQLKIVVIIQPLSIAVIGALLLVINRYIPVQISSASLAIIGLSITASSLIFFALKKGYLKLLIEALSKRNLIDPQFIKLNKESLTLLKSHLTSIYPEEVIYVLQTIEDINRNELEKTLPDTLKNPSKDVRCFSLKKVEQLRIKSMKDLLNKFCLTEDNPTVLRSTILALGAITNSNQFDQITRYLSSPDSEIIDGAITSLIKYGSEDSKKEAIDYLVSKAYSLKKEDNLIAATALKHIDLPIKNKLLLPLLKNSSLDVRFIACEAVSDISDERIYLALVENLAIAHTRDASFHTLSLFGDLILDHLIKDFNKSSPNIQIEFIHLLELMKENKSLAFLLSLLRLSNRKTLHFVLLSIKKRSYQAQDEESIETIRNLLKSESANISNLIKLLSYFKSEKTKILHDFLMREIELSQERCFLLLSFIYPKTLIEKVMMGFSLNDTDMRSNSIELLLQTLDQADQSLLMFGLSYPSNKDEIETSDKPKIEDCLLEAMSYAPLYFIQELLAAIIYTIGSLQLRNLKEQVFKLEIKNDPLMQETVTWTLSKL